MKKYIILLSLLVFTGSIFSATLKEPIDKKEPIAKETLTFTPTPTITMTHTITRTVTETVTPMVTVVLTTESCTDGCLEPTPIDERVTVIDNKRRIHIVQQKFGAKWDINKGLWLYKGYYYSTAQLNSIIPGFLSFNIDDYYEQQYIVKDKFLTKELTVEVLELQR